MRRAVITTVLGVFVAAELSVGAAQPTERNSRQSGFRPGTEILLNKCRIELNKLNNRTLAFHQPGLLDFVRPKAGTRINKGDIVAGLKSKVVQAAYEVAKIKAKDVTEIEYAKKARDVAKAVYENTVESNMRTPGTFAANTVLQRKLEWQKTEAAIEKSLSQKNIAGKEAEQAKAQLESYSIKAPFSGTVIQLFKAPGEAVRQSDPILTMVNTDSVDVVGYIYPRDRSRIRVGNVVRVEIEYTASSGRVSTSPPDTFEGRITFIDETVKKITRKILIKAHVPNPKKKLFPGLTARMVVYPGTKYRPRK